jgi:uncharacterized protein
METLDGLIGRELAARLPRQPGQKEERYTHLLSDEDEPTAAVSASPPAPSSGLEERVSRLEEEVAELRETLQTLSRSVQTG